MATVTASYYETIGLLAICDAIESVEGVKLANFSKSPNHKPSESEASTLDRGPPYPLAVSSPSGFNRQTANTPAHTFLAHAPAYLSGDNGPSVPPPPGYLAQPLANNAGNGHYPPPNLPPNLASVAGAGVTLPVQDYINLPPNLLPRNATSQGVLLGRGEYGQPQHRTPVPAASPHSSIPRPSPISTVNSVGSPQQPPRAQNYRQSAAAGSKEFKREICPICNRIFEGPKASTHKQQHIRRLHPQDYMPKRGGKKRVVIDPISGHPISLAAGQQLPESPQGLSPQPSYGSPGVM